MLSGKRFTLETSTVAVETVDGNGIAVTIPPEAIIKVVSDSRHGDLMIEVLWNGRVVRMFAVDIEERGTEVIEKTVRAAHI